MARLRMMPSPSHPVSTDSCRHRRRIGVADETLAKERGAGSLERLVRPHRQPTPQRHLREFRQAEHAGLRSRPLIKDAITYGWGVTSSQYLNTIFAGFEVWAGGDGLQVKRFCANAK